MAICGDQPPRSRQEIEYELIDTGIFDDDRYFDVFVTYAKASPTDLLIQIERRESRAGSCDAPSAAHPLVSQHLVVARASSSKPVLQPVIRGDGWAIQAQSAATHPDCWATTTSTGEGGAALVYRK